MLCSGLSYEALCEDPEVELVYIATPHSCHYENMELCIRHKKPVLCEKAFTMNAGEARKIMELAEQEQVFAAEAIWTRYMPSRQMIREVVDSGIIGKVSVLTANLSYPISGKERIMRPELAGGALLDIGVYGLNFALMHFGTDIERMESSDLQQIRPEGDFLWRERLYCSGKYQQSTEYRGLRRRRPAPEADGCAGADQRI